jgi:hypothetical protein
VELKRRITDALETAYEEGFRHFICGMALGSDLYFAEAVLALQEAHEGISLEAAIPYRDTVLYADRKDIPLAPGAHFIADLIGLPVIDERYGNVGVLEDVLSPAGQDIYVVKREDGSTFMFPCVPEFLREISLGEEGDSRERGIYVKLIDGFLEDSHAN